MTEAKRNIAPSPDVQYLPTIFRRIQAGELRIPAFQRGFVWDRKQVLELLESIFHGFPIGSVLLWKTNRKEMNLEDPEKSFFPRVAESFPTNYVLDGLQRLSSLYAVFHYDETLHPRKFDISFDLEKKEFISPSEDARQSLPLNILFRPTRFIKYHSRLSGAPDGPKLINNAVELLTTFQEYLLPIVTIEGRTAAEVVRIFERINSTGTRLGAVDFMRAVTWSEEFDLNQEIRQLRTTVGRVGFDIPQETLVKVLAIALGYAPTSDAMLGMRDLSSTKLKQGSAAAAQILKRTIAFFQEKLGVQSYALVPYEAQFLALVGFNKTSGALDDNLTVQLSKWYWTASLNEDMQGRSEHKVARLVDEMHDFRRGKVKRLKGKLTLSSAALRDRRFRWGTALSSAVASMLAKNQCRSLFSGEPLDMNEYLANDASANFVGFVDEDQVTTATGRDLPSSKVLANIVVVTDLERAAVHSMPSTKILRDLQKKFPRDWKSIVASQFISESAVQALLKGRASDFLEARAQSIVAFAQTLAFSSSPG